MKNHEFVNKTPIYGNYLSMLFVLLLPVVLNLCAPTLMGRGLRNTIITASILFLGVLFLFIRFLGRTIQDDLLSAEKLGI